MSSDTVCELCGKPITKEEATNSSQKIRNKLIGTGTSQYLWDVWIRDFCDHCVEREFPTWGAFESYMQRQKIMEYAKMN